MKLVVILNILTTMYLTRWIFNTHTPLKWMVSTSIERSYQKAFDIMTLDSLLKLLLSSLSHDPCCLGCQPGWLCVGPLQ